VHNTEHFAQALLNTSSSSCQHLLVKVGPLLISGVQGNDLGTMAGWSLLSLPISAAAVSCT
jgi:hypothetical protein